MLRNFQRPSLDPCDTIDGRYANDQSSNRFKPASLWIELAKKYDLSPQDAGIK